MRAPGLVAVVTALVAVSLSACIEEAITPADARSAGGRKAGYTPGEAVLLKSYSMGFQFSFSESLPGRTVQVRLWYNLTGLDCVATTATEVTCTATAQVAVRGGSTYFASRTLGVASLDDASSTLDCNGKPGEVCTLARLLRVPVNVTIAKPEGEMAGRVNAKTTGLLAEQEAASAKADRAMNLDFTIAKPGEKGTRFIRPPTIDLQP